MRNWETNLQVAIITLLTCWTVSACRTPGSKPEAPKPEKINLCDRIECNECSPDGPNEVLPECPEDSGWLCCNDAVTICVPDSDGECPEGQMQMWCDYYEVDADGIAECFDEFGQG